MCVCLAADDDDDDGDGGYDYDAPAVDNDSCCCLATVIVAIDLYYIITRKKKASKRYRRAGSEGNAVEAKVDVELCRTDFFVGQIACIVLLLLGALGNGPLERAHIHSVTQFKHSFSPSFSLECNSMPQQQENLPVGEW